jgi:glycosyltransferase involved in cell wall biosynthesis
MKLLVFAHTPPPHHGQSYMVRLMLDGLGGDRQGEGAAATAAENERGIACYHVNARLSDDLADVGTVRAGKLWALLRYCGRAVGLRFRHGVTHFYYVPTPPKRGSLYRDWLVMLLCRPWFRRIIFHWHAVGLGAWLDKHARPWERWLTRRLLGRADLALVLSEFNRADAEALRPRRVAVVANGIPDPCPDFAERLAPRRRERAAARQRLLAESGPAPDALPPRGDEASSADANPAVARVLYLAHCTRDKGVFDALAGVERANAQLAERGAPLRLRLTVAGKFLDAAEERDFAPRRAAAEAAGWLRMAGFVSGAEKERLFAESDLFCFPTYFANEGQPVNLLEAMAYGLPVVSTRWRSIPELLPPDYPGLIEPRRPDQVAAALLALLPEDGLRFRRTFLDRFTLERHLETLAAALRSV